VVAALAIAACGGSHPSGPVTLRARAASPLADAPVKVDVRGLGAHRRVVLRAGWTSANGVRWTSRTRLAADGDGTIALRGIAGMRFLWAMRPPRGKRGFGVPVRGDSRIALAVEANGRTLARTSLVRRITPPTVRIRPLTAGRDGVYGFLFTPPGGGRRPAAIVMGGSEGGISVLDDAGLLAAHGYPTLALAYFRAPGLPPRLHDIPLEYFRRGLEILRGRPDVDPAHVVTMGVSYGGEASLLIAATFPRLVHGAIALVPNVSVSLSPGQGRVAAWSYRGRPLAPQPIAVGRIDGPVLTAGAGLDNEWDSSLYVQEIRQRRADAHVRFRDTSVIYPKAGHDAGVAVPYLPQPVDQARFGGTAGAGAAARADLWPRILRYMQALRRGG
jgi:dienelactone hydrolase